MEVTLFLTFEEPELLLWSPDNELCISSSNLLFNNESCCRFYSYCYCYYHYYYHYYGNYV